LPPFLALPTWRKTFETAAERSSLVNINLRIDYELYFVRPAPSKNGFLS
jgi:hypothetical protein